MWKELQLLDLQGDSMSADTKFTCVKCTRYTPVICTSPEYDGWCPECVAEVES